MGGKGVMKICGPLSTATVDVVATVRMSTLGFVNRRLYGAGVGYKLITEDWAMRVSCLIDLGFRRLC